MPTVAVFIERTPRDSRLWEKYQALRADTTLQPSEQERQFRGFKRDFYERVIQVYMQQGSGLERDQVNRLVATEATYNRMVGFLGMPEEQSVCIL